MSARWDSILERTYRTTSDQITAPDLAECTARVRMLTRTIRINATTQVAIVHVAKPSDLRDTPTTDWPQIDPIIL